ncbi:MAG: hypothetical protein WCO82_05960 [Sphingomonadales bacterium]
MADRAQDPLIESLIGLAVSAAPLIRRARDAGLFKTGSPEAKASDDIVDAEVVPPKPAPPPPPEPPAAAPLAETSALQAIIVSQAVKIAQLEAEIAQLKAQKAG